jgi:HlyD family type I secretion membrane fusion protein
MSQPPALRVITNDEEPPQLPPPTLTPEEIPQKKRDPRLSFNRARVLIAVGFAVFLAWAVFAPLNRGSIAPGRLDADARKVVVQGVEGGAVREVLVREGDTVAADQVLLRLDVTTSTAALGVLTFEKRALLAERAALEAEAAGRTTIAWPAELSAARSDPDVAKAMSTAAAASSQRMRTAAAEREALLQQSIQLDVRATALNAQLVSAREQNRLIGLELEGVRQLADKGLAPKTRLYALERAAAQLTAQIEATSGQIAETGVSKAEVAARIARLEAGAAAQRNERLSQIQTLLLQLNERIVPADQAVRNAELKAPVAGVILAPPTVTAGGVVRPGDPVIEIIPSGELVARAFVRPIDVERVKAGLKATIRFPGLNPQTAPRVEARVTRVSADAMVDRATGATYYEATVVVNPDQRGKLAGLDLIPGMPVEVTVDAGARTAMEYLLEPVRNAYQRAFQE